MAAVGGELADFQAPHSTPLPSRIYHINLALFPHHSFFHRLGFTAHKYTRRGYLKTPNSILTIHISHSIILTVLPSSKQIALSASTTHLETLTTFHYITTSTLYKSPSTQHGRPQPRFVRRPPPHRPHFPLPRHSHPLLFHHPAP